MGGIKVGPIYPIRIMGVIHVSPESFYRGSVVRNPDEALERALEMIEH